MWLRALLYAIFLILLFLWPAIQQSISTFSPETKPESPISIKLQLLYLNDLYISKQL